MRLRPIVKSGSTSVALVLATISLPIMAQEGMAPASAPASGAPGAEAVRPAGLETPQPPIFAMPPRERADWLAECRRRIYWAAPYELWHHHETWRHHHRPEASPELT